MKDNYKILLAEEAIRDAVSESGELSWERVRKLGEELLENVDRLYTEDDLRFEYDQGYDYGYADGQRDYENDWQNGYDTGYQEGLEQGERTGYEEGYTDGRLEAVNDLLA